MSTRIGKWLRQFGLRKGIVLLLGWYLPWQAFAQMAPVNGAHYAARPSDTGAGGNVNVAGSYDASVPLDLPGARGGLPLPLQIVYGGAQVGAGGKGWDIPISSIYHETTTAYRRPHSTDTGVQGHERWVLNLLGSSVNLVRNADNTAWVAQYGDAQLEAREISSEIIKLYDGNGRTYTFDNRRPGGAGAHLVDSKFYLLTSIADATGKNVVQLNYAAPDVALSGGGTGLEIDLTSILYNAHPTTADCYKSEIVLLYDTPTAAPLSLFTLGGTVLARAQKLTTVGVNSYTDCSGHRTRLRTYGFAYQADADTEQPRLSSVTMTGQEGTAEASVTVPVASYEYGAISTPSGEIVFQKTQSLNRPNTEVGFGFGVTLTKDSSHQESFNGGLSSVTVRDRLTTNNLLDVTGDGRADFLGQFLATSGAYRNAPTAAGRSGFSGTSSGFYFSPKTRTIPWGSPFPGADSVPTTLTEVISEFIDMNGDGRLDFVEALDGAWVVHLNTPDPVDSKKSVDVQYTIPTANIKAVLAARGHSLPNNLLPLSRSRTAPATITANVCWSSSLTFGQWRWRQESGAPYIPSPQCPTPNVAWPESLYVGAPDRTITEWQLTDTNGDGYPDLVYNGSIADYQLGTRTMDVGGNSVAYPQPFPAPIGAGQFVQSHEIFNFGLKFSSDVYTLVNVVGAHIATNDALFAPTPVTLIDSALRSDECGIERWEVDPDGSTSLSEVKKVCGLGDVNGDGLIDRLVSHVVNGKWVGAAALGTGNIEAPFTATPVINLPGAIERVATALAVTDAVQQRFTPADCSSKNTYLTRRLATFSDINGDGLPDYISGAGDAANVWLVNLGTGAGFAPELAIFNPSFKLSQSDNTCILPTGSPDRDSSDTYAGLFELDGDGQTDFVALNGLGLDVYQIQAPTPQFLPVATQGVPAAGRLTAVGNGYGAVTRIAYKSAKEDPASLHQVSSHEIVVAAVATYKSDGSPLSAPSRFAYGNIGMLFDSAQDRFLSTGYLRAVTVAETQQSPSLRGVATITDRNPLAAFVPGSNAAARYKRVATQGRTSDVTTLNGDIYDGDAWAFLTVNTATDGRRIASQHADWDVRLLDSGVATGGNAACIDLVYPYDYAASLNNSLGNDQCTQRGFVYQKQVDAYRGAPGQLGTDQSVHTRSTVDTIDDLSRITAVHNESDLAIADDDLCTQTTYANPVAAVDRPRVLNAVAEVTNTNCANSTVIQKAQVVYDSLPQGSVSKGLVSRTTSFRLDESGNPLNHAGGDNQYPLWDVSYDAVGNPRQYNRGRDDNASALVDIAYDTFGLTQQSVTLSATNADGTHPATQTTTMVYDPVTLQVTNTTDANGTQRGAEYDGFGRVVKTLVKPTGGSLGALSSLKYRGFAVGDTGGRRVERKVFTDAVDPATVDTAAGRTAITYLDSLGRTIRTEGYLGADYGNQVMIVGESVYDLLGRVKFQADPHLSSETNAYGTTWTFKADGTPDCTIRGFGQQAPTRATDETNQVYPTCYAHGFYNNQEFWDTYDALSNLASANQPNTRQRQVYRATGQLFADVRYSGTTVDVVGSQTTYHYDALGRLSFMNRFQDPVNSTGIVTTTWHHDSFGQVTELDEPDSAPQYRSYDKWRELTQVQWTDATTGSTFDKRSISRYDALGRLVHSEDQNNQVTIPGTTKDFNYDLAFSNTTPLVRAANTVGRLSRASTSKSSVFFSYDGLGQVDAQVFSDLTDPHTPVFYVQKNQSHADGSAQALHLLLPDHSFVDEQANYSYDSAGRTRGVSYVDGGTTTNLFTATGASDLDVLGRIRHAQYGLASFDAVYADTGRRLIQSVQATTPTGHSRKIAFAPLFGTQPFDPLGREAIRREFVDGVGGKEQIGSYDTLGELASVSQNNAGVLQDLWQYSYDPLGNMQHSEDVTGTVNPKTANMSYAVGDRDRICSIGYLIDQASSNCNVTYDAVGNILTMPTRTGQRSLSYFPGGQVEKIIQGNNVATYDYDAFGAVQGLTVSSTTSGEVRHDKHFGALVAKRDEAGVPVVLRTIPVPGVDVTRHGPTGTWTFAYGEARGTRFATNQLGEFIQSVDYQPFGEVKTPTGAAPGSTNYTREQWNGGDLLTAFGVNQLGARIYDPVIGRFLSRDPVFDGGNGFNPYAFAANDPINRADPTGTFATLCDAGECPGGGTMRGGTGGGECALCGLNRGVGRLDGGSGGLGKGAEGLAGQLGFNTFNEGGDTFKLEPGYLSYATSGHDANGMEVIFVQAIKTWPGLDAVLIELGLKFGRSYNSIDVSGGDGVAFNGFPATPFVEKQYYKALNDGSRVREAFRASNSFMKIAILASVVAGFEGAAAGAAEEVILGRMGNLGPKEQAIVDAFPEVEGIYDVVGHAGKRTMTLDGQRLTGAQVGNKVAESPGFYGQPSRLLGCKTGCGDFAQQYSNWTGSPTNAPDGDLIIFDDGTSDILGGSGQWKWFFPEGPRIGFSRVQ